MMSMRSETVDPDWARRSLDAARNSARDRRLAFLTGGSDVSRDILAEGIGHEIEAFRDLDSKSRSEFGDVLGQAGAPSEHVRWVQGVVGWLATGHGRRPADTLGPDEVHSLGLTMGTEAVAGHLHQFTSSVADQGVAA